jgi:hypothetical protein
MPLPILPLAIAAGAALLGCLSCKKEEENSPITITAEPYPFPKIPQETPKKINPTHPFDAMKEVEKDFAKFCGGFFKDKNANFKSYCTGLWKNQNLADKENKIREIVLLYATHPHPDDFGKNPPYEALNTKAAFESKMKQYLSSSETDSDPKTPDK